jgi:ATP-dependent DNA helicase RecG
VTSEPLETPLEKLRGATPTRRELLGRLGIHTVGDLLFHFPRSYEDLTDLRPIASLTAGALQTVQGEVVDIQRRGTGSGGLVVAILLSDGAGEIEGVWFNQHHVARRYRLGQRLSFSGKPRRFRDRWQMSSPRVQVLDGSAPPSRGQESGVRGQDGGQAASNLTPDSCPLTPGVVPIYPLTEDLRPEQLRPLIGRALEKYAGAVVERLPESLRLRRGWPEVGKALHALHFPPDHASAVRARQRFVYEEFLLLQLALALRRREVRDGGKAPVLPVTPEIDARIRRLFPFTLTGDQDRAVADICADLASERPMQRLVQADVGAGKTAVAVYALLAAVAN